jgi:leader peptidase (prepilin peptidase)/N-methyltransferase
MSYVIAFIFGSMVGSFLNVCIFRMPKEESIVFPGSHCTGCQKPIAWYDNIPILSFLLLGAKCRNCKIKISWQYPLIEAISGAMFIVFLAVFGLTPKGCLYLYMALGLLAQTIIDIRYKIIPDEITLSTIVLGVVVSTIFPEIHGTQSHLYGFIWSMAGLLLGGGFLYAAGTIAEWVLKKEAMGGGDVKLLAGIGAVIGWQGVLWTIFLSSLLGSIVGVYFRLKKGEELIPFGPYLAAGAVIHIFFGAQITTWYIHYLKGF